MTTAMWVRAICRYRSVSAILRLWSLVRVGSFQMDLRMYGAIRTGQPSDADARVGGYPAFSARLKAVPGTAARLEAGNRKGGFACLFRVCAILLASGLR